MSFYSQNTLSLQNWEMIIGDSTNPTGQAKMPGSSLWVMPERLSNILKDP